MKIAYKIIAVILALVVIPVMFLAPLGYVKVHSVATQLLAYFAQNRNVPEIQEYLNDHNGQLPENIGIDLSIKNIISPTTGSVMEMIKDGLKKDGGNKEIMEKMKPVISSAITMVTILALILICAIVTAFFAALSNDNRRVIFASIVGIGLSMLFVFAFESFAAPFVDGTISLSTFVDNPFISLVGEIKAMEVDTSFFFIPLAFLCNIIWTVLYNMTLPKEEKRERKLLLGEEE